jgi:hypothetical protein
MKHRFAFLALLAGSCAAPQPEASSQPPRELAGRTAGPAQKCVLIHQSESLRVSDTNRHVLMYGSGTTLWANHLGPQCGFGRDDVLVTEPIGSYHCRGDIIRSFDRFSRIPGPSCILGDWVAYRRS